MIYMYLDDKVLNVINLTNVSVTFVSETCFYDINLFAGNFRSLPFKAVCGVHTSFGHKVAFFSFLNT